MRPDTGKMSLVPDDPLLFKMSAGDFSRKKRPSNQLRIAPVTSNASRMSVARKTVRKSRDPLEAEAEARLARSLPAITRGYGQVHGAQYAPGSLPDNAQRLCKLRGGIPGVRAGSALSGPMGSSRGGRPRPSPIPSASSRKSRRSAGSKSSRRSAQQSVGGTAIGESRVDPDELVDPFPLASNPRPSSVNKAGGIADDGDDGAREVVQDQAPPPMIQRQNRIGKRGGGILHSSVLAALNPRTQIDGILRKFEERDSMLDDVAILAVVDFIDEDGQGLVTTDEFEAAMRAAKRNEIEADHVSETLLQLQLELQLKGISMTDVFRIMDDSGDGILDAEEICAGVRMICGAGMNDEQRKTLNKAKDLAAKRRWRKRQENADLEKEWITRPECLPQQHQPKQHYLPPSTMPIRQIVGRSKQEQRTFERMQAEIIIELFMKIDLDHDGSISSDDLEVSLVKHPMLAEVLGKDLNGVDREPFVRLFSSMDADRDGMITLREFGMFIRSRPAHAEPLRNLTARRVRHAKDQKLQRRAKGMDIPDSARSTVSTHSTNTSMSSSGKHFRLPEPQEIERLRRVLDSAGGEALKVAGEERFEMRSLPNLHEMRSTLPVGIKYNRIDEGLILKKQLGRYQFESRLATLGA